MFTGLTGPVSPSSDFVDQVIAHRFFPSSCFLLISICWIISLGWRCKMKFFVLIRVHAGRLCLISFKCFISGYCTYKTKPLFRSCVLFLVCAGDSSTCLEFLAVKHSSSSAAIMMMSSCALVQLDVARFQVKLQQYIDSHPNFLKYFQQHTIIWENFVVKIFW